uniref:Uncharacterized protein n=1 Tax=Tanacetum cinerariifolium TaxID=118510 RepID=A0A6L2KBU9_TANCI|nr:hypothetical protein [Tanacetum cinerariifolium]
MGDNEWIKVSRKKPQSVFQRLKFPSNKASMVDDLEKISLSVYASNFTSYSKAGTLADVYIANRKNNLGQMFAFCCFIKVLNAESLIASMSNVRIGKLRLHSNVARFQRFTKKVIPQADNVKVAPVAASHIPKVSPCSNSHSYANVAKSTGAKSSKDVNEWSDYVLFEFTSGDVRNKFLNHKGVATWFSSLKPWHDDFSIEERLIWLEIEGVPLRAWEKDTFSSIAKKWGELLFMDDSDACNRLSKHICIKSSHAFNDESECEEEDAMGNFKFDKEKNFDKSDAESVADLLADLETGEHKVNSYHVQEDLQEEVELPKDCNIKDSPIDHCEISPPSDSDPFELASLINKRCGKQVEEKSSDTPALPPGFAPNSPRENQASRSFHQYSKDNTQQPGFSMIQRLEETIKVGIALGLNMEGCENTLTSLLA